MRRSSRVLAGVVVAFALGVTACGSGGSSSEDVRTPGRAVDASASGTQPSKAARMICAHEAQEDLAGVLATKPVRVTEPTWSDQQYACDYVYGDGTVSLSVKELPDDAATTAYFDSLGATLGRLPEDLGLGQGAFATPDGSVVVRKDRDVLHVDVSGLPDGFRRPARTPSEAAGLIAVTVLRCWEG